jgi:hypothetical protein
MMTERRALACVGEAPRREIAGGGAKVVRLLYGDLNAVPC